MAKFLLLIVLLALLTPAQAQSARNAQAKPEVVVESAPAQSGLRIKDLASIQGVRQNQLLGYGLVVGLDGSGDQTTQTPFTVQSVLSMLQQLGVNLPAGTSLQLKNVAAVTVTASLPPFAQPGQTLDVTVSSIGNAKSLRGGVLLMTPLKGADNHIYAMAQGQVVLSQVGAAPNGQKAPANHLSVGRVPDGATVERAVANNLGQNNQISLELLQSDFSTASRVVDKINAAYGSDIAYAQDGRVIKVRVPSSSDQRVAFLGALQNLRVEADTAAARVIINARTGSVVMNQAVTLEPCAISHGNLSLTVEPAPGSAAAASGEIKKEPGNVLAIKGGANLAEVVKALNAIGATPQDLLAILQAMKAAGSLKAELEVI
ncbi:flagellar basal body P-ring protein FlgI [Massilia sp. W12]|uniref:flagellar basal body P-ring protein FlgI n=1 Tax=Massilia sp. W12 TaxID=3126507 RepID=UPI0030CAD550